MRQSSTIPGHIKTVLNEVPAFLSVEYNLNSVVIIKVILTFLIFKT